LAAGAIGRHHRYGLMKPSSDRRAADIVWPPALSVLAIIVTG
jgi:hypothetical protein